MSSGGSDALSIRAGLYHSHLVGVGLSPRGLVDTSLFSVLGVLAACALTLEDTLAVSLVVPALGLPLPFTPAHTYTFNHAEPISARSVRRTGVRPAQRHKNSGGVVMMC